MLSKIVFNVPAGSLILHCHSRGDKGRSNYSVFPHGFCSLNLSLSLALSMVMVDYELNERRKGNLQNGGLQWMGTAGGFFCTC